MPVTAQWQLGTQNHHRTLKTMMPFLGKEVDTQKTCDYWDDSR